MKLPGAFAILTLWVVLAAMPVHAQPDAAVDAAQQAADQAERQRIETQRRAAGEGYAREEAACYQKLSVNSCLADVRARRRVELGDLKRQETALNDTERKRKAALAVQRLEARNSAEREAEAEAQRQRALADQQEREARAAGKADAAAAARAAEGERSRQHADKQRVRVQKEAGRASRDASAAGQRERFERRRQEAQERQEKVEKRLQDEQSKAGKPRAKPLPEAP